MQALDCRAQEYEIAGHAVWSAGRVKNLLASIGRQIGAPDSGDSLRAALDGIARDAQARPVDDKITNAGAIARMVDPGWWKRNVRRTLLRENETQEHAQGLIQKNLQCYVSDHAVKRSRERDKANQMTLAGLEVISDTGEVVNLGDVAASSVSNPKHRRAELMTRCKGFEDAAEFMGHEAWFLTMTTPKRFHRKDKWGGDVKKWDGSTPKDAQAYLCKVWKRIGAALKYAGIVVYGFRVAEPHQDGTPHWHILIFCEKEQSKRMLSICGSRAKAMDRYESGARQHRFTAKRIDPAHGGATGYIAKYICKNIDGMREDGEALGIDQEAEAPAEVAALRVRDWARAWKIRQFQQIGGPSVTVWREFRRLGEEAESLQNELFEKPRAAANRGAWMDFWMVQGGPSVPRKQLTVKPYYVKDTGSKYGDETQKIKGVEAITGAVEITRLKEWTVQRAGSAAAHVADIAFKEVRAFRLRNAEFLKHFADFEFKRIGEAERTRTGVNNYRPPIKPVFDFASFEGTEEAPKGEIRPNGRPSDINRTADFDLQLDEVRWAEWDLRKLNAAMVGACH